MFEKIPKEVIIKENIKVNVGGVWEEIFPPGRYPLIEGIAVGKDRSETEIFLIGAKNYNSWLSALSWFLLERESKVELIF